MKVEESRNSGNNKKIKQRLSKAYNADLSNTLVHHMKWNISDNEDECVIVRSKSHNVQSDNELIHSILHYALLEEITSSNDLFRKLEQLCRNAEYSMTDTNSVYHNKYFAQGISFDDILKIQLNYYNSNFTGF